MPSSSSSTAAVLLLLVSIFASSLASDSDHKKMLTGRLSVSLNSMNLKSSILKMPSNLATGLSSLWMICLCGDSLVSCILTKMIIHVNLTQDNPRPLEAGRTVDLTYSVQWIPTNVTFARRFDVYLDYPFFEHQFHSVFISL
ncbi:Nonaspanin (TM9SF) protein [Raphanus sativus]|nr:Nonaspanin (TM9SF) protein [Raphanus sativus]